MRPPPPREPRRAAARGGVRAAAGRDALIYSILLDSRKLSAVF